MTLTTFDLGAKVGLIGDVHANQRFLNTAIVALADRGASGLVQLGDWGLIWSHLASGREREARELAVTNELLELVDMNLLVILGNHENYDAIDALPVDPDGTRRVGRVWLSPRSGRATAAGRPVGWLGGAGSIDRGAREAGESWWPQEVPSDEEVAALADGEPVDIVFAHDALSTTALADKLAPSRNLWYPPDATYAEETRDLFTTRVLPVLADGGLVVSGHYHFRFSAEEALRRPDGSTVHARSEILSYEWEGDSVALLNAESLELDSWQLPTLINHGRHRELVQLMRGLRARSQDHDSARNLLESIPQHTWDHLGGGQIPAPQSLLDRLDAQSNTE